MLRPGRFPAARWATLAAVILAPPTSQTHAESQDPKLPATVRALRVSRPPVVDGHLSEEAWTQADPASTFTQRDPDEGEPATERTEVRVLYDDEAVYIGARMFDGDAPQISRRLSDRDADADADRIQIYLDPMHDHKTGVEFRVSASNVQKDAVIHNDSWGDGTWDAVWRSAVSVDDRGWSAEMRIPLSQLRFPAGDAQTWGINFARFIHRKNETDWFQLTPKTESGLASRMAHLTGLDKLNPRRHFELLPYTAARSEFIAPTAAGNPFNDGSRLFAATGVDMKYGLTSNLTLDGTINPDFGQVEVDPAVVNLTAFETFFEEKRPFFLEGSQTFGSFGRDGATDNWNFNASDPTIFYSRRIGRAPQVESTGDFIDTPNGTTILGAAKVTGTTAGGWALSALNAVTGREISRVHSSLATSRLTAEPLSNYFAARLKRTIGRGGVGFIATGVNRRLDTPALEDALADQAQVLGGDGYIFLDRSNSWVVTGKFATSRVSGTRTVIERLQRTSQRYLQRPDAPHVTFDPTRTALSGYNGRVNLNRNSGSVRLNAAVWGVSPGFESNDLGFMGSADRAGAHAVVHWRDVVPDQVTRDKSAWVAKWYTWNFNGDRQSDGVQANGNVTLLNYFNLGGGASTSRATQDDRLTRGGPSAISPRGYGAYANFGTDERKPFAVGVHPGFSWNDEGNRSRGFSLWFTFKPSSRLTLSTGPQINRSRTIAQYVTSVADPTATETFGGRYVFGSLEQTHMTLTTRVSINLSPQVSIRLYAQPLLASGNYAGFKELAAPRTFAFTEYGGASSLVFDSTRQHYTIDPDGDGPASSFDFADPDFNLKSLRVNAVFRWEIKPGSTFYGVWTRQQQDTRFPGDFRASRDVSLMFSAPGDDVFLVKMAYWIGR